MNEVLQLAGGVQIPILYEDRAVLAIDKPAGWMLAPGEWRHTGRNLQVALEAALAERPFWVRRRNLRFLRYVHRLDAETTGVLLLVRSRGALEAYSALFESRQVEKRYLAVVQGRPPKPQWTSRGKLAPETGVPGRMRVHASGKEAETRFAVLRASAQNTGALIEAHPITGRTHQIRVHLAEAGLPVIGDKLYGGPPNRQLALRAVGLAYFDPFRGKRVNIRAPEEAFLRQFGFW